jgi:transcriptional regulator
VLYNPSQFREERIEVMHELMRVHSLATLVTVGSGGTLEATHLPLIFDREPAPYGTLRGHMARANAQWREARTEVDALAIFQGPSAYVSPSWYPSKQETGRVVPTYNYAVVHAHGPLRTYDDPARLREHLRALTAMHEAGREAPWTPDDAPAEYIEAMLAAIVGIEIPITRLEGKWKVSQNRPAADRAGVAGSLEAAGDDRSVAMARLVRERGGAPG